ncbi:MAG: metal-dependent hydrolase [Phycicoccus sp.]
MHARAREVPTGFRRVSDGFPTGPVVVVMGRSHAVSGVAAGLVVGPLLGARGLDAATLGVVMAGAALLPDLDHPRSAGARVLGPVTGVVAWVLVRLSRVVYQATATRADLAERPAASHRTLTHTVVGATVAGVLVGVGTWLVGPWVAVPVIGLCAVAAGDRLSCSVSRRRARGRVRVVVTAVGLLPVVPLLVPVPVMAGPPGHVPAAVPGVSPEAVPVVASALTDWRLGVIVATGCVVHSLGDAITISGVPLLWPLLIRGETWWEVRPPQLLRLRTGGRVERWVVFPVLCGLVGLAGWWVFG